MNSLARTVIPPLLLLALLLIGWQLRTPPQSPVTVVPGPAAIVAALARDGDLLLRDYVPVTLLETGIGLAIAAGLGVGAAALLDAFAWVRYALYPLLIVSQTIPLFALAPVLILILGFGIEPKITIVVLFCAFPIAVATLDGLGSTAPEHLRLLRSFGANRWQVWRKIRLPSALPGLFSGLRIAATYSVTGAILGEYIAPTAGIGKYMRSAYQTFKTAEAFAAAALVIGISLLVVGLVAGIERLSIRWYYARVREGLDSDETGD